MRWTLLILLCAAPLSAQADFVLMRGAVVFNNGATDEMENTGASPFNLTYTITNVGTADLNLTGTPLVAISGEDNCNVTVIQDPVTPVTMGGGTTTFRLQVAPVAATEFSFALSIANDDPNSNPFAITFDGNTTEPEDPPQTSGGGDDCSTHSGGRPSLMMVALGAMALLALRRATGARRGAPHAANAL
jgi:hypothetical protein